MHTSQDSPSVPVPLVLDERRDGVATLTLNRPERLNALNGPLARALVEALNRVAEDVSVRAVVLTGAGRGFCAGGDLTALRTARETEATAELEALLKTGKQIVLAIAGMPKPVLAAVNGPAAGAGVNLALACTLRIASESASFTQSFVKIGLFPDFGGTYFLPRIVGTAGAAELFYTGDTVIASAALRLGIVSRVVPRDALTAEGASFAERLAAAPPLVSLGIKQMLFVDYYAALEHALDEEIRWQMSCFHSEDFREGLEAFLERRRPHFRGA